MKTLIVTGGSLDISWAKDFVRTINAEYIIAADSGLKYIDELGLVPDMILGDYDSVEDGLLDKYKSIDIKTYKCIESRSVSHIYTWGDRYKDGSHIYQYMQYEGCT